MCHIGMQGFRAAHQVHLLAVLCEDVAVLAGRGARRDEAHPAAIHALLQLPLDDLRVHTWESNAVSMHTLTSAAGDRLCHLQLLTVYVMHDRAA